MAMEFEYGCQTANKYMFFEENEVEDPSELLAKVTKKEEAPKTTKPVAKTAAKTEVKGKPSAKDNKKPLQQQTENKQAARGQQKGGQKPGSATQAPREDKENTSNRPQGERRAQRPPRQEGEGGPRPERRGPRPEGDRPPRRFPRQPPVAGPEGEAQQAVDEEGKVSRRTPYASGRGGFRSRRVNDTNSRDFDRHSGSDRTGVKSVDKREGAGKANWGTPQDELAGNEEAEQAFEETKAEDSTSWAAQVDESEEKKEEDKEEPVMTLAEYKAKKDQQRRNEEFNIRKPGEGEDLSKWGKAYVLKKKVEEEEEAEEEEEEEEEIDEEEEKRRQLLNSIQIRFNEPVSRGGQRGGRGGFRGPRKEEAPSTEQSPEKRGPSTRGQRGGRQPGRGNNHSRTVVPKIEDEKDFPSLGK